MHKTTSKSAGCGTIEEFALFSRMRPIFGGKIADKQSTESPLLRGLDTGQISFDMARSPDHARLKAIKRITQSQDQMREVLHLMRESPEYAVLDPWVAEQLQRILTTQRASLRGRKADSGRLHPPVLYALVQRILETEKCKTEEAFARLSELCNLAADTISKSYHQFINEERSRPLLAIYPNGRPWIQNASA